MDASIFLSPSLSRFVQKREIEGFGVFYVKPTSGVVSEKIQELTAKSDDEVNGATFDALYKKLVIMSCVCDEAGKNVFESDAQYDNFKENAPSKILHNIATLCSDASKVTDASIEDAEKN